MAKSVDLLDGRKQAGCYCNFTVQDSVHVNNREDKETVTKMQEVSLPAMKAGVSTGASISLEAPLSLKEQIMAFDLDMVKAIDEELGKLNAAKIEPNYFLKLEQAVVAMLMLQIQINNHDRVKKEAYELKVSTSTKKWGECQKEIGDRGLNFTWITLGVMALQFVAPQNDQPFIKYFAEHGCTNISNMFNGETQSKQKIVDTVSQLAMAEINAQMNKGSSDSSSKQEVLSLLEKMTEVMRRAAQAQG
ncbi:MAG: hypothetical protein WCF19_04215 [Chlamydiales bacterium]